MFKYTACMQKSRTINAPVISIAIYRPKRGKAKRLLGCLKDHMPVLRSQKLITARKPIIMRAKDGTIIEGFEWKSVKSIEEAHHNPVVAQLWEHYNNCCTYHKFNDLAEADQVFAGFEPVEL